jgi:hypothetical protein
MGFKTLWNLGCCIHLDNHVMSCYKYCHLPSQMALSTDFNHDVARSHEILGMKNIFHEPAVTDIRHPLPGIGERCDTRLQLFSSLASPIAMFCFCFNHTVFTLFRVWQTPNPQRLRASRLDGEAPPAKMTLRVAQLIATGFSDCIL